MIRHPFTAISFPLLLILALFLCCSFRSHEKRGDGYFNKGRYQDALAEYLMAKRSDPRSSELLFKIGKASSRLGDMGMACAYYDTLLDMDSTNEDWIINDLYQVGVKSLAEGDTTSMRESFQMILDIDSTYNLGTSFYNLGSAYQAAGQYDRAVRSYLKALSYAPDETRAPSVIFDLALCYEQLRKYKEAIAYFEDYMEKEDVSDRQEVLWHLGSSAYNLAETLFQEGNLIEAQEYLQVVIDSGQPQVLVIDAWFLLGEINYSKGDVEEALESYNEVIKLNPSRTMIVASKSVERIRQIRYGEKP